MKAITDEIKGKMWDHICETTFINTFLYLKNILAQKDYKSILDTLNINNVLKYRFLMNLYNVCIAGKVGDAWTDNYVCIPYIYSG